MLACAGPTGRSAGYLQPISCRCLASSHSLLAQQHLAIISSLDWQRSKSSADYISTDLYQWPVFTGVKKLAITHGIGAFWPALSWPRSTRIKILNRKQINKKFLFLKSFKTQF